MRQDSNALLLYCRPGFEGDCAAEVTEVAANLEEAGYCRAKPHSGFVVFQAVTPGAARRLWTEQRWRGLVFARQWLLIRAEITGLPTNDRAGPLAEAVVASGLTEISEVWLEFPDTNAGKELSRFCRKFTLPLTRALSDRGVGVRSDSTAPRLHVFFTDSASATLAVSAPGNSAPWPLGIPRLRMAKEAPSRSTLKLDEALRTFL
ncbi:MAG: 23S rRNA (cytidine(2498)-2'-O)-methyltransferase RlmM, partial [Ectothiorhodospiraceae bacterium]